MSEFSPYDDGDEPTPPRKHPSQHPIRLAAPLASGVLHTAREALDVEPGELAAAAGCAETLVRRIESGDHDPALDTLERILNASGLEIRAGHKTPDGHYAGPSPDHAEASRVRESLTMARSLREEIGAPAPGPPTGALPDWDGEDPAPGRPFGADENRTDGGGWAAVLLRSAQAEARSDTRAFAYACGVTVADLERIQTGELRPTVGELASMLARAGTGLRVRLEVYDDHDDGLHFSALARPGLHRRRMRRGRAIFAGT